ncbi:MAG: guanylate kinase [Anaerolineales bacterium]|nr:guanylate kinase [Anaerolineales bacterium]
MCDTSGFGHQPQPLMIVLSGPSGVGKDSVIKRLLEKDPSLAFVVTAASRDPRPGEVHGADYYFLPREEFERRIASGDFLENAVVYGELKGILKEEVQRKMDSGRDVVMRIDVQGAATIREKAPEALLIFLTTNDEEELINRLIDRKTETRDNLELRIETAKQEMKRVTEFDYKVVNPEGCIEEAVDTILAIIKAEHHAIPHRKVNLT